MTIGGLRALAKVLPGRLQDRSVRFMTSPAISSVRPIPLSQVVPWLLGAVLFGLGLYYLVGIDEGATSLFGSTMWVHELVHDSRHFLGFPCH